MFGGKKWRERHTVPGAAPGPPLPDAAPPPGTAAPATTPWATGVCYHENPLDQLDQLAARYARGEIIDTEFGSEKHRFLRGS